MVSIRRIRADEGPAFRAIRLEALRDSPMAFGSSLAETEARPAEYWQNRASGGAAGTESVLFVAENVDRWIGVVGGFIDGSTTAGDVDLISMWVHPTYRGLGVGRSLVDRILAWARERGAQPVVLWVTENNSSAISLYQRCGFRDTGETQPLPSHPHLVERQMALDLS